MVGAMPILTMNRNLAAVAAIASLATAVSGCGGSSKPGYCQDRTNLQNSISGLTDIKLGTGAVSQLSTQLDKVRSDAQTLVSSAKSDFPTETSAITRSIDNLQTSIKATSSSPSASDVLAIGAGVKDVADAITSFNQATKDKC
jgi:hypothetical protein